MAENNESLTANGAGGTSSFSFQVTGVAEHWTLPEKAEDQEDVFTKNDFEHALQKVSRKKGEAFFGENVRDSTKTIKGLMPDSPELGQQNEQEGKRDARIRLYVKIAISGAVLTASFYVMLSPSFPDDYGKWAFGMIGLVVGYCLQTEQYHRKRRNII